jgi:hypothetical protein
MEKDLGLYKKYQNMSDDEKAEVRRRKREAGEEIHLRNLQELENQRIQSETEQYAKQIQAWIASGKTVEEAETIVKNNYDLVEKRKEKLAARQQRQTERAASKK